MVMMILHNNNKQFSHIKSLSIRNIPTVNIPPGYKAQNAYAGSKLKATEGLALNARKCCSCERKHCENDYRNANCGRECSQIHVNLRPTLEAKFEMQMHPMEHTEQSHLK